MRTAVRVVCGISAVGAALLVSGCDLEKFVGSARAQPLAQLGKAPAAPPAPAPAPAPAVAQDRTVAPLPSLAPLVESVKAAVVNVDVAARGQMPRAVDPFGMFSFGPRQAPVRQGSGSGFIIDAAGRVLTNNHVVENAVQIRVRLDDGRSFEARILGRDPQTDLALLELQGVKDPLPVVKLGDSDALRVGDYVVAIGNPFGLASSVSSGILSARARDIHSGPYDDFLQTDAAINPGNSGGPLFNLKGEVVGINTAIIGGATGIGFAVPASTALALLPQLEAGEVRRGWLGVAIQDLTPELARAMGTKVQAGAVVADVNSGTPAAEAGIRTDDVIVSVDGSAIASSRELSRLIGFKKPGSEVVVEVQRGKKREQLKVLLGEHPEYSGFGKVAPAAAKTPQKSERLGISLRNVDPRFQARRGGANAATAGAEIVEVEQGSRADHAGLRPGMIVVEAGGQPVRSARDLVEIIERSESGSSLLLRVELEGARLLRAVPVP